MDHLTPEAKNIVGLPFKQRSAYMKTIWLGYERAVDIMSALDELLEHPDHHRMPCVLVVGSPFNGKSTILERFQLTHSSYVDKEQDLYVAPVVSIQMPHEPNELEFYNEILNAVSVPHSQSARKTNKKNLVLKALESLHTRVLVIDEFHHILAGTATKQRAMLQLVKWFANQLHLSIVAAGTKSAYLALQTDPQMASRFTPYTLPKWNFDEDFYALIQAFEKLLPLKNPSNLIDDDELMEKLFYMTDRTIGQISKLLVRAADHAIKSGEERITKKTLAKISWKTPKDITTELEQDF